MAFLHTDVCIIGNELAGLVAGALLSHAGKRVVVIDPDGPYETKAIKEYLAPTFPMFWQLPKFGSLLPIFDTLEIRTEIRQRFSPKAEFALMLGDEERMIFYPHPANWRSELMRVFGERGGELFSRLERFEPWTEELRLKSRAAALEYSLLNRFMETRRANQFQRSEAVQGARQQLESLCKTPLAPYIDALLPFLGYTRYDPNKNQPDNRDIAAQILSGGTQISFHPGESPYATLRILFEDAILRHGGDILRHTAVSELEGKGASVQIVKTNGKNHFLPSVVINATSDNQLSAMLCTASQAARMRSEEEAFRPQGRATILRWLLPRAALPRALPGLALHLDECGHGAMLGLFQGRHLRTSKISSIFSTEHSAEAAPMVAVLMLLDSTVEEASRRMQHLLPLAKNYIIESDTVEKAHSASLWPLYSNAIENGGGQRQRSMYSRLRNVFRTGRDVAPQLGLDGELMVGGQAAKAATAYLNSPLFKILGAKHKNAPDEVGFSQHPTFRAS